MNWAVLSRKSRILQRFRKASRWGANKYEAYQPFGVTYSVEDGVSSYMGYLKGKSSLMIYEKYPELKYKYRNREFWCTGYYVDTAGKNAQKIQEYINRQLEGEKAGKQLAMGDF